MAQYPNEKDPHSNWVYPTQGQGAYASRDGAPAPPPAGYAAPSQPPPPQGYYPSQGAPQGYYLPQGAHAPQGSSQGAYPPQGPSQAHYPPLQGVPQGYYPPPPHGASQGYYPTPQGPPPDYGYAQAHPGPGPVDRKGEVCMSPPATPHSPPPPGSEAGPSQEGQSSAMSLGAFFGNKGPPPMWHRQPPPPGQLPYNAFPPMCLISNGKDLSSGFPDLPPPCQMNPHPFATHDVTEEDWKRFLVDVKKAGSLSGAQRIKSNVIPMVTGMSFVTGFMATMAIEKKMKYKNRQAAGDLVDHWNHYFFGPRRMEVVLCQASERLSGRLGAAPVGDPHQQRMANGLRKRGPDDSSDDDSSSEEEGRQGTSMYDKHSRRAAKRERREARRARRAERRARKARGEDREPYQLFITAIEY